MSLAHGRWLGNRDTELKAVNITDRPPPPEQLGDRGRGIRTSASSFLQNCAPPPRATDNVMSLAPAQPSCFPDTARYGHHMATDQLLLDFLTTDLPLTELAHRHGLSLPALLAWADSPETQKLFADLSRIAAQRHTLIAAESSAKALGNLAQLSLELAKRSDQANLPGGPKPPSFTALETSRKACATLLRILPKPERAAAVQRDFTVRDFARTAREPAPQSMPIGPDHHHKPVAPQRLTPAATTPSLNNPSLLHPATDSLATHSPCHLPPSPLHLSRPARLASVAGRLSPAASRLSPLPSAGIPTD
jgi:hypothetical protein